MTSKAIYFLLSALLIQEIAGHRILAYFPLGAKSHHNVFQPILQELGKRGHQVTYYTSIPMAFPHPNVKVVNLENFMYKVVDQSDGSLLTRLPPMMQSIVMSYIGASMDKLLLPSPEIQELIHSNETYDLVFHEGFFIQEHAAMFMHKFKAPGVVVMPLGDCAWVNELSGLPDNPSYMIDFKLIATDKLNFLEKLENTWALMMTTVISYYHVYEVQKRVDQYARYPGWETRPSLFKLLSDQSLIFTNSHHSVGYAYPKAPHVREIGGINVNPPEPLPQDLQQYLDSAKDGVIYFSFGSVLNMSKAAPGFREPFSKYFGTLKQKVLWKVDEPWPGMPSNIKTGKWFPQQSLLAHKNVKMFITHGGLLSAVESISNGVPMIVIPFFGDQYKNARRASSAGYGIELYNSNITVESVAWAVREILENPSYKREAVRRKALFGDRPMKPLDEAVYWIEYVLRHGSVLQPASTKLSFIQLYLLDVWAFIVALSFVLFYWLPKKCIQKLSKNFTDRTKKDIRKKKQ